MDVAVPQPIAIRTTMWSDRLNSSKYRTVKLMTEASIREVSTRPIEVQNYASKLRL